MQGYSCRQVAKMLSLSEGQVRSYVRKGLLAPERGPKGEYVFSFQDLVILRTARGLLESKVPAQRVRRALARLRDQLPAGRPLTGVHITAEQDRVVVRDGRAVWQPESGQVLFDFGVADLARKVEPLVRRRADEKRRATLDAAEWFEWACEVESAAPGEARDAYRRVLELEPRHSEAHVNLGRLLHEAGDAKAAEAHYRLALETRADDVTALFNLGVVLEDQGRAKEAAEAYERALAADPAYADAHYNAARIYERLGKTIAAIRHLKAYRKLTRGS